MTPELRNGTGDCDLFGELVGAEVIDEGEIGAKDLRFMDLHVARCPQCAAFEGAMDQLRDPTHDPLVEEMIDRALREHAATGKKIRLGSGIVVIAAICGIAAMVVLALGGIIPLPFESTMLFGDDDVMISRDGSRATAGQILTTDAKPAFYTSRSAVEIGLDVRSSLEIESLHREAIELNLHRGRVAFHLVPDEKVELTVITPLARILVTGTVFMVEVTDSDVSVGVLRGSVEVQSKTISPDSRPVAQGEEITISSGDIQRLDMQARNEIRALLHMEIEAEPSLAAVAEEPEPDEDPPPTISKTAGAAKNGGTPTTSASKLDRPVAPSGSPGEYILEARECRKMGDWAGVARAYGKILGEYPASPEAITILLPLAEVELEHLGNPARALSHFREYERRRPTGPLAQEALFGICTALRALGREDEEIRALGKFLKKYPDSIRYSRINQRLITVTTQKD
jgi:TolA-binding protein